MRPLASLLLAALLFTASPALAQSGAGDPYADVVYNNTPQVYQPQNILGAPDGHYTDFFARDEMMTLDMGEGELGTGSFSIHYRLFNFGASYFVEFLDGDFVKLDHNGAVLNVGQSVSTIPYNGTAPYRYVRIFSRSDEILSIDAVEAEGFTTAPQEETPPPEEPPEEVPAVPRGLLITLPDDGNPLTSHDEAVYVIGENGQRHAFPNERVFFSWYPDFESVAFIDGQNLAGYQLGMNVTIRPGTWLMKITNDPKVYAIEPGSVLRHIASEEIARALYGADWADRVIDMPDVFWSNYTVGDPIESALHPNGTLGILPEGRVVYIRNGVYYGLTGEVMQAMRLDAGFAIDISADIAALYVDGGDLQEDPDIAHPY